MSDAGAPLETLLESLRASEAARSDPARLRFLQALSRRLPGQHEAVRRLLEEKLRAGLAEVPADPPRQPALAVQASAAACTPLLRLNQYIRSAAGARDDAVAKEAGGEPSELASVRRFRSTWELGRSLDQVERAVARKPAQAGPLNSHVLMLQSLALMRELSPEYLRRFIAHVETLQWLEQAGRKPEPAGAGTVAAKRARGGRAKK